MSLRMNAPHAHVGKHRRGTTTVVARTGGCCAHTRARTHTHTIKTQTHPQQHQQEPAVVVQTPTTATQPQQTFAQGLAAVQVSNSSSNNIGGVHGGMGGGVGRGPIMPMPMVRASTPTATASLQELLMNQNAAETVAGTLAALEGAAR